MFEEVVDKPLPINGSNEYSNGLCKIINQAIRDRASHVRLKFKEDSVRAFYTLDSEYELAVEEQLKNRGYVVSEWARGMRDVLNNWMSPNYNCWGRESGVKTVASNRENESIIFINMSEVDLEGIVLKLSKELYTQGDPDASINFALIIAYAR